MTRAHENALPDATYRALSGRDPEITHRYGDNFHILADPFLLSHLGRLCARETTQPSINSLVKDLYRYLVKAVLNAEFPRTSTRIATRMADITPAGHWEGQVIDPHTLTVTVNIARAGTLPSQVCYDFLNKTMEPQQVRQDHFIMARETDEKGRVIGTNISGSKIGGPVDDAMVLFPDPMGATGGSLSHAISVYKKTHGKARRYICLNLIVTPEYLRRIKADHPDVVVYAVRLDRGASPADVLGTVPGTHWDRESGLTDKQYIVPGGGGFGEIMNNAYV
ncbi:MAG: uracil phosphoribosyltransferase [Deltaproteobacteria bacterium]|nr:uracil phosphoribosyltransferase [Deltaproteobacteria bacterium]